MFACDMLSPLPIKKRLLCTEGKVIFFFFAVKKPEFTCLFIGGVRQHSLIINCMHHAAGLCWCLVACGRCPARNPLGELRLQSRVDDPW